jgi:hypothetical protein
MSSLTTLRASRRPGAAGLRRSGLALPLLVLGRAQALKVAALLLALAQPALAAELPWTRNLAGRFGAGSAYSGALVWDQTATAGLALLVSDGYSPSLVLTSLTGTGPALKGANAIYGVAVQGQGTRSGNHNVDNAKSCWPEPTRAWRHHGNRTEESA